MSGEELVQKILDEAMLRANSGRRLKEVRLCTAAFDRVLAEVFHGVFMMHTPAGIVRVISDEEVPSELPMFSDPGER